MNCAVTLFPGMNCENETILALRDAGFKVELLRWNTKKKLGDFDCFVIPGGFSYEDRIRAGVISARDPLMEQVAKQAHDGKVVLGICNGAQVLVESGLVPGFSTEAQMGLAPNINPEAGGFLCTWARIKPVLSRNNAFNLLFSPDEVINIPVAHGEGRFVTKESEYKIRELVAFQYCDEHGNVSDNYPINPNGSLMGIAGLTNKKGNVLAIMPHPERVSFQKHTQAYNFAPLGIKIFKSMRKYIEEK